MRQSTFEFSSRISKWPRLSFGPPAWKKNDRQRLFICSGIVADTMTASSPGSRSSASKYAYAPARGETPQTNTHVHVHLQCVHLKPSYRAALTQIRQAPSAAKACDPHAERGPPGHRSTAGTCTSATGPDPDRSRNTTATRRSYQDSRPDLEAQDQHHRRLLCPDQLQVEDTS